MFLLSCCTAPLDFWSMFAWENISWFKLALSSPHSATHTHTHTIRIPLNVSEIAWPFILRLLKLVFEILIIFATMLCYNKFVTIDCLCNQDNMFVVQNNTRLVEVMRSCVLLRSWVLLNSVLPPTHIPLNDWNIVWSFSLLRLKSLPEMFVFATVCDYNIKL